MIPPGWQAWFRFVCLALLFSALISGALSHPAKAAGRIPAAAKRHRDQVVNAARWELGGLDAPVAVLAAQIHQESGWREDARSAVGAQGLAQIMPKTAEWLAQVRPDLGPPDVWHARWAIQAMAAYDAWHLARVRGRTQGDLWAKVLAAYNGGLGWVYKDEALAERRGLDRLDWWSGTALVNAGRSRANWSENRGYPARILKVLTPRYVAAGWGPGVRP